MSAPSSPLVYFVLHHGVEQGPFTLEMIGSMIVAGIYVAPLQVRESRSNSYQILEMSPGSQAQRDPSRAVRKSEKSSPFRMLLGGLAVGMIAIIALVAAFSGSKSESPRPPMPYDDPPVREGINHGMNTQEVLPKRVPGDSKGRVSRTQESGRWLSDAEMDSLKKEVAEYERRLELKKEPLPPDLRPFFRDSNGQFHYVSHDDSARLTPIKEQLDRDGDAIDDEDRRMLAAFESLETERLALDNSDQRAIDAFNRKVADLNKENLALRSKIEAFNQRVDAFNAELKRVAVTRPIR